MRIQFETRAGAGVEAQAGAGVLLAMHQRAAECKKNEKPKTGRHSFAETTASPYLVALMSRLMRTVSGSPANSKSATGAGSDN